jgi:L-lactate dehydrogenase (cytochrome)
MAGAGAAARTQRKPPRVLRRMLALDDFEEEARRYLPRPIFGYVSGGAVPRARQWRSGPPPR